MNRLLVALAYLLGAWVGVGAGLLAWAAYDAQAAPDRALGYTLSHLPQRVLEAGAPALPFAITGALIGLMMTGYLRARRYVEPLKHLAATLLGGLVGLLLALALYVGLLWMETQDLPHALERARRSFQLSQPFLLYLATLGTLVGAAIAAFIAIPDLGRRLRTALVGTLLGALIGLVIHAVAYVATQPPLPTTWTGYVFRFGQAVNMGGPLELLFIAFGALVGLLLSRHAWQFYGLVTLTSLIAVVTGFLAYSLAVTLPRVEPQYRVLSWILFAAETFSLLMVVLYSFYTIDVAARKRWRRGPKTAPYSEFFLPKVAFHVPTYNEPPQLVEATLRTLLKQDYPKDRYVIIVADDSTKEESAGPLREFCQRHDITYVHRDDRTGYKAGALNNALKHTPADVEFIAIIDADYQVERDYLAQTMGYFVNPRLAWVQTPQDYRNRDQSFLTEQYYVADAYFYRTVLPSRNEENTIIFCGTMGILRRSALEEAGGWGEKYISEDAELAVRLLKRGHESLYVNKTFGRGLIPPTFDGYKKQHYRWAFGGAKILRGHFWDIVGFRFSRRQSFDYLVGSIHWFEGVFILLIAAILFLIGLGEVLGAGILTHHSQEVLFIGLVPVFLLMDGITRIHLVMRRALRLSFGQTLRVLGMWFSLKFSNARAAILGLIGFNLPFVRTPKAPDHRVTPRQALSRAFAITRFESITAALMLGLAIALAVRFSLLQAAGEPFLLERWLLVFWVLYYFFIFLSAPLYAYKSYVTFRPQPEEATPHTRSQPAASTGSHS